VRKFKHHKDLNLVKFSFQLILLLVLFVPACKPKHPGEKKTGLLSNLVSITDNEDKGIKEIIAFYGGQCEYGFEKNVSGSETNFWLKFSKSAAVDKLAKTPELPGSNIAYLFYKNLDKEKNNYNQIQTELVFSDGHSQKFSYPVAQLEKVKEKIRLIGKVVALIKDQNFTVLKNYLKVDTALFNYDKDLILSNLQKAESEFGNIKQFIPYGFTFSKADNGKEILHVAGLIQRDQQSNYFSVNLDPNTSQDEIYSLNYKL
jgi:hypothetical protein